MPVHKRTAKALKRKAKSVVAAARRGDILPSVPSKYGVPPIGLLALAKINPRAALVLGTYMALEKTESRWGPPLYDPVIAAGDYTARQWEEYQDWYEQNIRPTYAGTEIDPGSPVYVPPGWGAPRKPARALTKPKRKISKANKAMKMAYNFYRKKHKGKMTQKKCRMLMRKASKMAGKANPHTKSRIGKGGDWIKRHCRKVRKGVWNTSKRSY